MPKSSSFLKGVMPLVYAIVAVPVFLVLYLWFLVDGFGVFGESVCRTEVQGRLAGSSGYDFEISETSCFFDPAPFYVGPYPTITSTGEHASSAAETSGTP